VLIDLMSLQESHFSTMFIEIIGKVQDDLSIKVLTGIDLGDSIGSHAFSSSCLSVAHPKLTEHLPLHGVGDVSRYG
jgi:hypothetical protein